MGNPLSKVLGKMGLGVALMLGMAAGAAAQYTDWQAIEDLGGPKEFVARRAELATQAKTGYTILFARNEIPESSHYREDNDFYYYTGVQDPGAVLVMDNASDAAQVQPLLPPASCLLLVTSRRQISLPGLDEKNLDKLSPDDARTSSAPSNNSTTDTSNVPPPRSKIKSTFSSSDS